MLDIMTAHTVLGQGLKVRALSGILMTFIESFNLLPHQTMCAEIWLMSGRKDMNWGMLRLQPVLIHLSDTLASVVVRHLQVQLAFTKCLECIQGMPALAP